MDNVDPVDLLRRLGGRNVEVDDNRLLVVPHDDAGKRFVLARINLLVGNERWYGDEVARSGFGDEFGAVSPPHPRVTTDQVDHALKFSMVVGTGLGIRVDRGGTRPQLVCANCGMRNSRCTCHTRRLGSIKIELVASNYPNTVKSPVGCWLCRHFVTPFPSFADPRLTWILLCVKRVAANQPA